VLEKSGTEVPVTLVYLFALLSSPLGEVLTVREYGKHSDTNPKAGRLKVFFCQ
jgi:hypothetical protein